MTKLEEKLIELGYEKTKSSWQKRLKGRLIINIHIFTNNELVGGIIQEDHYVMQQSQINNLQLAFNEMQKDLEELRKYEKEN